MSAATIGWPHGECECVHGACACSRGAGPAAFLVERGGKDVKVCTRCDFRHDKNKRLLVTEADSAKTLVDWDALGAFVVAGMLHDKRAAS